MSATEINSKVSTTNKRKEKIFGVALLTTVAGASALGGFSYALTASKKQAPTSFAKGLESGATLAFRAFGWGSLYAIAGVGLLTAATFAVLGVHDAVEFRVKMEQVLQNRVPRVKEADPPGRRNFNSIRDLFGYLSTNTTTANGTSEEAVTKKA